MPRSINVLVWVFVLSTALPHYPDICATATLAAPAAQQATHRIHCLLSYLTYPLPLRWARFVQPSASATAAAECASLLSFLQVGVGTLLPLLAAALSEARLFQAHQQERQRARLLPVWCPDAGMYEILLVLTGGGSWPRLALLVWLLLAVSWDWTVALTYLLSGERQGSVG